MPPQLGSPAFSRCHAWDQPSQKRCPRGRANGIAALRMREADALCGQPVDVRRANVRVPAAGQRPGILIVGQDENDIGGTHRGSGACYGDKPKGEKTEGFMER